MVRFGSRRIRLPFSLSNFHFEIRLMTTNPEPGGDRLMADGSFNHRYCRDFFRHDL